MARLDDAKELDLEERARQLAEEADRLREETAEPVGERDSKREANEALDRRLAAPLEKLRKLAR